MTSSQKPKAEEDKWDFNVMNSCKECQGALHIMPPCSVHGSTPFNTYMYIQNMRNMPDWECEKCGEKGKSFDGCVPYTHEMSHKKTTPLDLSSCHTAP